LKVEKNNIKNNNNIYDEKEYLNLELVEKMKLNHLLLKKQNFKSIFYE
jgi:hypothetical protein